MTVVASAGGSASSSTVRSHDSETVLSLGSRARKPGAPLLESGESFGTYRIERLLGRGGMGEVYEAEHLEHGRRVAMKVLTSGFAGREDRARFLREGELAASINHPHTVYVFGSEEIDGAPVITMELLTGGTLRDLVQSRGALPTREAVDLILQVIAGLEAAQAVGVLHRDIKPANCFVDASGPLKIVKVGDFGLSLGAAAAERSGTGSFQGTPQFAPPEQLSGEALDVRADIYAVGATLFYLLTGQPPFDDQDLTTLITRVKAEPPRSPRDMTVGVPDGLATLVTQCLAKDRAQRPASYALLEDSLRPFSSVAPVPAPLGLRALAGFVDGLLFSVIVIPTVLASMSRGSAITAEIGVAHALAAILYYSILESVWGASIGKRIFGLRVRGLHGERPGFGRALVRAVLYQSTSLPSLTTTLVMGSAGMQEWSTGSPVAGMLLGLSVYLVLAVLFSTARRRNGFAGVHDLISRTRVVRRPSRTAPSAVDLGVSPGQQTPAAVRGIGPYDVIGTIGTTATGDLFLGRDPRLKRSVWIHRQAPGAPSVPLAVHDIGRGGRLRWMTGRRTATEAWDAYEAVDGVALSLLERPQPWVVVRRWLLDLASEIEAGRKDGTLDRLSTDRVWLTAAVGARLLDFRAPRIPVGVPPAQEVPLDAAQPWLAEIADRAVAGPPGAGSPDRPDPLPPSATAFLDRLRASGYASLSEAVDAIRALSQRLGFVTRQRRAAAILLACLAPGFFALSGVAGGMAIRQLSGTMPEADAVFAALRQLSPPASSTARRIEGAERASLEVYIVGRFGSILKDSAFWSHPMVAPRLQQYRDTARDLLVRYPSVTPEELEAASRSIPTLIAAQAKRVDDQRASMAATTQVMPALLALVGFVIAAAVGLLFAFAVRGGLMMKLLGLAVVDARGHRVGRWHAAFRALTAWAPAVAMGVSGVILIIPNMSPNPAPLSMLWLAAVVVSGGLMIVGAIAAAFNPSRGFQDRIAGTWVVPD